MHSWLPWIIAILSAEALIESLADILNARRSHSGVPDEFKDLYDEKRYRKSQSYLGAHTRLDLIRRVALWALLLLFLIAGGFGAVDAAARQWAGAVNGGPVTAGLFFVAILGVLRFLIGLPFSLYSTFSLEARFGFNRTTPSTYLGDLFKGLLLTIILGAPVLAGIFAFFETLGPRAWIYVWLGLIGVQILLVFIAPILIMPLFNRFQPIPQGDLRERIEEYLRTQDFRLNGVFTMDGSKRSTKANAFFTGFGRFRRLVFFDTLLKQHPPAEIVAVLAHEIGHFKRRHIPKFTVLSALSTGLSLFVLSRIMDHPSLFDAFRISSPSIYAGLVLAGILYGPFARALSIPVQALSRRFEFEADRFAATTYGQPEVLISALKRLSAENLSHLTPHPMKVWLDYSHPPVLKRIDALRMTWDTSEP